MKTLPKTLVALATALSACMSASAALAQTLTVTPLAGYRWGGSVDTRKGELRLEDSEFFGAQLDYRVRPDATAVLLVDYQPTTLRLRPRGEPSETLFDLNTWYFQVGGTLEVGGTRAAAPFATATVGMSWFDPRADDAESEYAFAGIIGGGVKVPFSEAIGLKLQARLLLNIVHGASSLWCSSGSGCYVRIGGVVDPVQFDIGGGLTLGGDR